MAKEKEREEKRPSPTEGVSDSFYRALLENVSDGVYFVSPDRQILYWNKTAEKISGFSAEEAVGRYCHDNFLNHVSSSGVNLCLNGCPLHATLSDGLPRQAEVFLHHKEGYRVPVLVRTAAVRDENGEIIGAVETFMENGLRLEERRKLHSLEQEAYRDPLLHIGNRRFIEKKVEMCLFLQENTRSRFGFALLDADGFKNINDSYGHKMGDKVLLMVADTLRRNLRANDSLGRWGGDEFIALVTEVDERSLHAVTERLRILVAESRLRIKGVEIGVTVSIGATLAQLNDTADSLFERADALLYQSKRKGGNVVTIG